MAERVTTSLSSIEGNYILLGLERKTKRKRERQIIAMQTLHGTIQCENIVHIAKTKKQVCCVFLRDGCEGYFWGPERMNLLFMKQLGYSCGLTSLVCLVLLIKQSHFYKTLTLTVLALDMYNIDIRIVWPRCQQKLHWIKKRADGELVIHKSD